MAIDPRIMEAITTCISALPLWSRYKQHAAVVLTGSLAAGLADEHSDIDVEVLVPEPAFTEWYEPVWAAVDGGAIAILNPRARLFNEYPITKLPGLDGHYQITSAPAVEARIRGMDDVARWIYANSLTIADESGLHARLCALAATYPEDVLDDKRRHALYAAKNCFYGVKMQLQRDHRASILLVCSQSISHTLKYCCLCDGNPFPYEKWLYQVGVETTLGRRTRKYVDAILAELGRDSVVFEKPGAYVAPGHRNEAFEDYRLYHLFLHLFDEIDAFRREKYPDEVR